MAEMTALSDALATRTGLAPALVADKLAAHLRQFPGDAAIALDDVGALERLIATLLVHETYFYRHIGQWELLRRVALPGLVAAAGGRRLRAWCAGCATGEEVWSLAHLAAGLPGAGLEILGTDISGPSIATARAGIYRRLPSMGSFRDLPDFARADFPAQAGESWEAPPHLRAQVRFAVHNVMEPAPLPHADLVFCRNMLIYFAPEAAQAVLRRIAGLLPPGGLLVMSPVESPRPPDWFTPLASDDAVIYRRSEAPL